MAKTKGPLLSLDAHGSLSKLLTYSNRRSGQQVRKYNKPLVVPSAKQRGQRRLTEFLVAHWQNMSSATKATWEANAKASGLNLPGYQYFLREAQRDPYTHHGLAGYWHCNEIVGGKVLDLSGRGNHGTLQPNYPSDAPVLANSMNTRLSKGLQFNGSTQYIEIPAAFAWTPITAITIEVLIKLDDIDKEQVIFGNEWDFYYGPTYTRARCKVEISGVGKTTRTVSDHYSIGKYQLEHFVYGIDNYGHLYSNAKEASYAEQPDIGGGAIDTPSGVWYIGVNDPADVYWLDGFADELAIYNRAFSVAEILTRYKFLEKAT